LSAALAWTEVRVLVPQGWQELVAEALALDACTSVAFGRPSLGSDPAPEGSEYVRTFFPAAADSPELRETIRAALEDLAARAQAPELAGLAPLFRPLPAEDYASSWKKSWKPFRVGRLAVIAPWSRSVPRASDLVMRLEPGGAFGSGRHATTRACLRAIEERLAPDERVLDAGSGSGILAVAAALFGAREAFGFDLDPNAEPYAQALAADNGVDDRCRFRTAGFEAIGAETFDCVLSNIYADVIQAEVERLRDALRPGGWFAFSGCSADHARATEASIRRAGLVLDAIRVRGRWHTFVGTRPGEQSVPGRRRVAPVR
jgi:ribosomal protein L11 methyltransferase